MQSVEAIWENSRSAMQFLTVRRIASCAKKTELLFGAAIVGQLHYFVIVVMRQHMKPNLCMTVIFGLMAFINQFLQLKQFWQMDLQALTVSD